MSGEPAFEVRRVQQFTFTADSRTLACIFSDIANVDNPNLSVNIRAYLQLLLKNGHTLMKIVPGVSFGFDFADVPDQTERELSTVRRVLRSYCVDFCEDTVLFVSATAVPGQLRRVQALFNAVDVSVIASYIDESTFSIYEVSNNHAATEALTLTLAEQDAIIDRTLRCDRAGNCDKDECEYVKVCKCRRPRCPKY